VDPSRRQQSHQPTTISILKRHYFGRSSVRISTFHFLTSVFPCSLFIFSSAYLPSIYGQRGEAEVNTSPPPNCSRKVKISIPVFCGGRHPSGVQQSQVEGEVRVGHKKKQHIFSLSSSPFSQNQRNLGQPRFIRARGVSGRSAVTDSASYRSQGISSLEPRLRSRPETFAETCPSGRFGIWNLEFRVSLTSLGSRD